MTTCQVPQADQSRVAPIVAGTLGMTALILCALRVLQRAMFKQSFGLDDALIITSLVCAAPLNCLMFPCKSDQAINMRSRGLILDSAKLWPWNQHVAHPIR